MFLFMVATMKLELGFISLVTKMSNIDDGLNKRVQQQPFKTMDQTTRLISQS